jgi:DNA ligase-1
MKFSELAVYLDKLEKTPSRIQITKILSELFKKADNEEIDKLTYLILGGLAPKYKNVVFNIAEQIMVQVITQAYGGDLEKVKKLYKTKGDLGDVAETLAKESMDIPKNLSVLDVYEKLLKIAEDEGEGSQERKILKTASLLGKLDSLSVRFVTRIPVGKLRLGFSDKTILDVLSWMEHGDKSAKTELEQAYFVLPDVGLLAKSVKKYGTQKASKNTSPVVGIPVIPMLAQRLKSPTEMIKKMGEVAVEPKFDGLRISIHYKAGRNGFIKTYTRNMNETSWMFPELNNMKEFTDAKELILDSEAMGLDEESKSLANFQATMTRRRKHEVESFSSKVPIKFYVFDMMLKDGKSLMNMQYKERRKDNEHKTF